MSPNLLGFLFLAFLAVSGATAVGHLVGWIPLRPSHFLLPLVSCVTWFALLFVDSHRKMLGNVLIDPVLLGIANPAVLIVLAKIPRTPEFRNHVLARFAIPFGFLIGVVVWAFVPPLGEC